MLHTLGYDKGKRVGHIEEPEEFLLTQCPQAERFPRRKII